MQISVIISTYNKPEWLEKVLWGYVFQQDTDFEIVIADDGSGPETFEKIDHFRSKFGQDRIKHVWHEDDGFRKSIILNRAVKAASGAYLIFTDGDCIPRSDFVKTHRANARIGHFLSGGYFKLSMKTSKRIDSQSIQQGYAFDRRWLRANGLSASLKSLRLAAGEDVRLLLDWIIPTKKTWNGNNSSAFKEDILRVNGHDERMAYGGQDVEMGYRLVHLGLRPMRLRYRALVLHLDHSRGYAEESSIRKNLQIRQTTLQESRVWTDYGIVRK